MPAYGYIAGFSREYGIAVKRRLKATENVYIRENYAYNKLIGI
jgi:hypothetical protein